MKLKRLYERYHNYERYVVRQVYPGGYMEVSSWGDEAEYQRYDEYDLDSAIDFLVEAEEEYEMEKKFVIIKITEEQIDDSVISIRRDAKKYNL